MATKTKDPKTGEVTETISIHLEFASRGFSSRHVNEREESRTIAEMIEGKFVSIPEAKCLMLQVAGHRGQDPARVAEIVEIEREKYREKKAKEKAEAEAKKQQAEAEA